MILTVATEKKFEVVSRDGYTNAARFSPKRGLTLPALPQTSGRCAKSTPPVGYHQNVVSQYRRTPSASDQPPPATPTESATMGRLHSNGKGISSSAIPYSRTAPSWLKTTPEQVVEQISKLARKGATPSQIGVILRDSHGIAQVKVVTGTSKKSIRGGSGGGRRGLDVGDGRKP